MWLGPMVMGMFEGDGVGDYNIFGLIALGISLVVGTKLQIIARTLSADIFDQS